MPKVDPTGYQTAIAAIPKGQLSERQQRIAAAIAMVRDDGVSTHEAARVTKLPQKTVWRYANGKASLTREQGFEVDARALHEASYDIAHVASESILESLSDRPQDWKPGDLVKAYGVATDKILAFQRVGKTQDETSNVLSRFLMGSKVTIEPKDAADEAIDVTPDESVTGSVTSDNPDREGRE